MMKDGPEIFIQQSVDAEREKDRGQAIACLKAGVEAWPQHPDSRRHLVELLLRNGRLSEAETVLSAAPSQMARRDSFQLLRVQVDAALGRIEQACDAAYDLALGRPDSFRRFRLALALSLSSGREDRARLLVDGVAAPSEDRQAKKQLLLEKGCPGNLSAALEQLEQRVRASPEDPMLLELEAEFWLKQGRIAEAWRAWQQLMAPLPRKSRQERMKALLPKIISESRIDAVACAEMEHAAGEPREARHARVGKLVSEEPNHMGAALALLNSLRESGVFRAAPSFRGHRPEDTVPKRVAHYWPSDDIPADIQDLISSWSAANPGVPCEVFSTATAENFIQRTCGPATREAFRLATDPNVRADLLRLAYLAQRGGFFVDTRVRCRGAAVQELCASACSTLLVQEPLGSISASLIGTMPGEPFILHCLQLVTERILLRERDRVWMMSGAGALTTAFCSTYAHILGSGNVPASIRVIPHSPSKSLISLS